MNDPIPAPKPTPDLNKERLYLAWGALQLHESGPFRAPKPWGPFHVERQRASTHVRDGHWVLMCDNEEVIGIDLQSNEDGTESYIAWDNATDDDYTSDVLIDAVAQCLAGIERRLSPWLRACRSFETATAQVNAAIAKIGSPS